MRQILFYVSFLTMSSLIDAGFLSAELTIGRRIVRERNPKKKIKTPIKKIIRLKGTLDYWKNALTGNPLKERPRMPGYTGFLYLLRPEYYSEWLYDILKKWTCKRHGWGSLYNSFANKPAVIAPYGELPCLTSPNPFLHSAYIAEHIASLIHIHKVILGLVLRYVQRRRLAKMNERIVGEEDLHTTIRIPTRSLVAVYDFKSSSCYHFHTNTLLRTILSSLTYSSYGIARPHAPKNPYTNVEWTYYQLMSIMEQLTKNRASLHRLLPDFLLDYKRADYVIHKFAILAEEPLGIHAAVEMFKLYDDPVTQDIYVQTLDDAAQELDISIGLYTRRMVYSRKLKEDLQRRWDSILLSFWIHTNLHMLYGPFISYTEMASTFRALFHETRIHVQTMYREDTARRQRQVYLRTTTMPAHTVSSQQNQHSQEDVQESMEETSFINSFLSVLNL